MTRGFACIALDNPKDKNNVGSVLRAAMCFRAALVVLGNPRADVRAITDTMKTYRHVPVIRVNDVLDTVPYSCTPIAVEFTGEANGLSEFEHPDRAYYVFGAEDQTLGKRVTDRCADVVRIDTRQCLNLAMTTSVVLYDRCMKRNEWTE